MRALLAKERQELAALLAARPRPPVRGELVRPMPEREPPASEPLPERPRRKQQKLTDLF